MEKIGKIKYLVITASLCLTVIFNFLQWQNLIIGVIAGLLYLAFYSFIFGSTFIPRKNWPAVGNPRSEVGWQIIFGFLSLLSLIAILGTLAIYFYQFSNLIFILMILLIPIILITPYYHFAPQEKFSLKKIILNHFDTIFTRREPKTNLILVFGYLIVVVFAFLQLWSGQTSQSIQSPWQTVPGNFIVIYFSATLLLMVYLFRAKRTKLPLLLLIIHTFLSTSVALIVYKIGYGFDPFIHQATEKIINQTGKITPTPLYYLGQYSIAVFLAKLTGLGISFLDKLLVPLLTALFLPTTVYFVFSRWLKKNYALILALLILIIPYSGFIMTAPQNLANLFFVVTILLSLLYFLEQLPAFIFYLLALAVITIHPLAGLPLISTIFLFTLFKTLYHTYKKHLNLFFLAALVFVFIMPLAFVVNGSVINLTQPDFNWHQFNPIQLVNHFDLPLDLTYLINFNKIILALLVIGVGVAYLKKNRLLRNNAPYLFAAIVVLANYLIVKYFLVFPELNSYDQAFFVNRLLTLAFYILIPIFLIGLHVMVKKFYGQDWFGRIFIILITTGLITMSFYLSYPRVNQYEPAKFFSLSDSDIKAVNLIEQTAEPEHVVLANQMVGVVAIKEYGFKKYYNHQFYYSLPNGSPKILYDLFLEMTYQGAKKETMAKAMAEAGVNQAYFVLNQYWRDFEKIAQQAGQSADETYLIDNGEIYVFKYLQD